MHTVPLDEAKTKLPDLIEEALRGGDVVILKDGEAGVKLVPIPPTPAKRKAGSAKGLITMSDDFDEPLQEFADYMP